MCIVFLWAETKAVLRHNYTILRACGGPGSAHRASPRQDLVGAAEVHGGDDHLGLGGLQRELRHLAAQLCEQPLIVERPQRVQRLQRHVQRLGGRPPGSDLTSKGWATAS